MQHVPEETVRQPAYDHEFARLCEWLKKNRFIGKTTRKENLALYTKAKPKNLPTHAQKLD